MRARQTAQPLADALGLAVEVCEDLRESGMGAWDGLRMRDLETTDAYRAWVADPEASPPPGGERLSHMAGRIASLLKEAAAASDGGRVAAFSHMDPIIAFVLSVAGQPFALCRKVPLPCGGIVRARWTGSGFELVDFDLRLA